MKKSIKEKEAEEKRKVASGELVEIEIELDDNNVMRFDNIEMN